MTLSHEYSGNYYFPVKCGNLDPDYAFGRLHKWEGEYGNARKRLLKFCIEYLTNNQNELNNRFINEEK